MISCRVTNFLAKPKPSSSLVLLRTRLETIVFTLCMPKEPVVLGYSLIIKPLSCYIQIHILHNESNKTLLVYSWYIAPVTLFVDHILPNSSIIKRRQMNELDQTVEIFEPVLNGCASYCPSVVCEGTQLLRSSHTVNTLMVISKEK